MTTIAYRDGIMAADSLVSGGGLVHGETAKIHRVEGMLIGITGNLSHTVRFLSWAKDGMPADRVPNLGGLDAIDVIAVAPDGTVTTFDGECVPQTVVAPFYVAGSGCRIALGAMAAGASAEQAVRIASRYDTATGGTICVERI